MAELNWARNHTYRATRVHYPETLTDLRALVKRCGKIRALGARHSFNDIADSQADLVSLDRFEPGEPILAVDRECQVATVRAGARYGTVCEALHREGLALPNLASLPHITVAGACATATHGSGDRIGNLATPVSAMQIVTADGEVVSLSRERDGDEFDGAVVGLGAVGVVTSVTLEVEPAYSMRQNVYLDLPRRTLEERFDEITSSAGSVSLFTKWQGERFEQAWVKRHVPPGNALAAAPEWFGAEPAATPVHALADMPADNCTDQMGVVGPWHERLPHFRVDHAPRSGDELQSEYLLPRRHAIAAFHAIAGMGDQLAPLLQISEVRTVAADRLWMSTCYGEDSVAIHFTWHNDWPRVEALLYQIEERLAPFNARPHWGKLFTIGPAQLRALYPRKPDFKKLLLRFDPDGKFRNAFLDRYIID